MTSPPQSEARRAGRGGIAVLGAKVFFVVSGLAQQALLPRAVGLAGYGALARVLALSSIVNNVVIASSVQGVSRVVARSLGRERDAFRSVFRVHLIVAVVLAALFAALAPAFAWFEGAPHITSSLALMGLVVLSYGAYAPIVGLLNGRGAFTRQAALDVSFAVLRTAGMVTIGWLFVRRSWPGVVGATVGFVVAAACIVPLALRLALPLQNGPEGELGETRAPSPLSPKAYLDGLWPLAAAQLCTNAVMQVDITLLGHFLSADAANATAADEWVGVYRACQLFAFLPYQLLLSITQVLFPMLARAKAEGDALRVKLYVERGARLAAISSGLMVSVLVAMPASVLGFAYTPEIAARGASTLRILALGQGAYTQLAIATTILASLGLERKVFRIMLRTLIGMGIACAFFASRASFGAHQLLATAVATSIGLTVALVVAALAVRKETGGFVPLLTAGRVLLALAIAGAAGSFLPTLGRVLTPFAACAVAVVYVVVLIVSRELTKADVHALRALRD